MRELRDIFNSINVIDLLEDTEISKISQNAVNGYESDDESRSEWKKINDEGMKLAMQISGTKNYPFPGASNVIYPLISISAIQFSSRAYPNLIPGWEIVKGKVIGRDDTGEKANIANRVSTHMNYQLNEEMTEWEEESDRLLIVVPIIGCAFKETYWSINLKRNVSKYCSPNDLVMNYKAESMETVPRITKKYILYPNEIIERIRSGIFCEFDIPQAQTTKEDNDQYENDDFKPHVFLQQHTWLDLDGDGYKEPYILNIHYDLKKVVRIVPRFKITDIQLNDKGKVKKITSRNHYTKFPFIPSADGSIYDKGFGSLLSPINHTVDTAINQLLDAGTWNNSSGGFIGRGINLGRGQTGGVIEFRPNEWLPLNYSGEDIRKNILPISEFMKEPSSVLFNLLGFMINAGEKLSSVTDLLMGEQTIQNEPATTSLARIEQGLKVFSSIHKRLHKSFGKEYKLLFDLNAEYLDPNVYYKILDDPSIQREVALKDYDKSFCDVVPTSSPDDVSNTQKMMKAQLLFGMKGQGLNDAVINKRFLEAMQIPDMNEILNAPPPPPDPKLVLESEKLDIERSKLEFDIAKYAMEIAEKKSIIIKNLADAESKEAGRQLEQYKTQMETLITLVEQKSANKQE